MSKRQQSPDWSGGPVEKKPPKTKRERFIALAEKRVNRAIKAIRAVERMASRQGYEYTEEEAGKVVACIGVHSQRVADAFAGGKSEDKGFRL